MSKKLRAWRIEHNLSQAEMGNLIGISSVAVGRYERGRMPEAAIMQKIIDITAGAISANDFFDLPDSVLQTSSSSDLTGAPA